MRAALYLERGERGAILTVDYRVFGKGGQSVMHGEASQVRFERHNSRWGIVQFGKRRGAATPNASDAGAAKAEAAEGI